MKEKQSKKIKMPAEDDSQRETRVLLEGMNSNIRLITEQHGTIVKKLEEHDRRFDTLESAILNVDSRVKNLDVRVEKLEQGQEEIKQKLDTIVVDYGRRICNLEKAVQ